MWGVGVKKPCGAGANAGEPHLADEWLKCFQRNIIGKGGNRGEDGEAVVGAGCGKLFLCGEYGVALRYRGKCGQAAFGG